MTTKKMSVSISSDLAVFIHNYKTSKDCKSVSQVIEAALILLRDQDLENAYKEADKEIESEWEVVAGDGLKNEAW